MVTLLFLLHLKIPFTEHRIIQASFSGQPTFPMSLSDIYRKPTLYWA